MNLAITLVIQGVVFFPGRLGRHENLPGRH